MKQSSTGDGAGMDDVQTQQNLESGHSSANADALSFTLMFSDPEMPDQRIPATVAIRINKAATMRGFVRP